MSAISVIASSSCARTRRQTGTRDEIFLNPSTDYTRGLIAAVPSLASGGLANRSFSRSKKTLISALIPDPVMKAVSTNAPRPLAIENASKPYPAQASDAFVLRAAIIAIRGESSV
ncbi:ABC-type dipeptide/oligopeptide/nickel transport system ATPase component [Bradyrhizobium sp. GM0.4]